MNRNSLMLAGLLAVAGSAQAANTVKFFGAGATSMIETMRIAAGESTGLPQFPAVATDPSYSAYRVQLRVTESDGTNNSGPGWIVVKGTAGNRDVWAYASLDSTVGVRCYFKSATITQITTVGTAANPYGIETSPANSGPGLIINEAIDVPADVQSLLIGKIVDAGVTDITPVDAKATTAEQIAAGYNNTTNPIRGYDGNGLANGATNVVDFNLAARSFVIKEIGAAPLLAFVNKQDTTAGGFGAYASTGLNINLQQLAGFYDGTFKSTTDIILDSAVTGKPVVSVQREQLSGTYVTFEYCVLRSLRNNSSQEALVDPLGGALNEAGWSRTNTSYTAGQFTQGGRLRGSGGTSVVRAATRTPNAIGYSFWSTGTFAGQTAANTFYLTVDGVDPIKDSYTNGSYPTSASELTFKNVKNGSYPIWSFIRGIVSPTAGASILDMLNQATVSADTTNLIPLTQMRVFRSHRTVPEFMGSTIASNGIAEGTVATGADAGGLVFSINAEQNYFASTGVELTERRQ